MKKVILITLVISAFFARLYTMETIEQPEKIIPIASPLPPKDAIIYLAGYCKPYQKNILMKLNKTFNKYLQDREAVVSANPANVSSTDKIRSMFLYAASGNVEKLRVWLNYNFLEGNINHVNMLGMTAFHVAAENKHFECMRLLFNYGAGVNWLKLATHPLFDAVYKNDKKMVKELLKNCKIYPNLTIYGATALHIAAFQGCTDIVKLLLKYNICVNGTNIQDCTPLRIAADYGYIDIVQLLIEKKANLDKADNLGYTPLHVATLQGHIDIIKLLLRAGANIYLYNDNVQNPMQIAQYNQDPEIIKLFQHHQKKEDRKKIKQNYEAFLVESPIGRICAQYQKYIKSHQHT